MCAGTGRRLFAIAFRGAMDDQQVERLARRLSMTTHLHPKLVGAPAAAASAILDAHSLLLLRGGEREDVWVLEGRTWGEPPAQSVARWQALAHEAARALDPRLPRMQPRQRLMARA